MSAEQPPISLRSAIERRIQEYLADDDPQLQWAKAAVRKHGFLPLYVGWVAALGIRSDASMVRWDYEEGSGSRTCPDAGSTG